MTKELILITAGFPYGNSETFLETEICYLSREFDCVKIIAVNAPSSEVRGVPHNCEVQRCKVNSSLLSKLFSVRFLFFADVWREFSRIKKSYQLTLTRTIFKTILISYENARQISRVLHRCSDSGKDQVFYSYWSDDSAIALALLKHKKPDLKVVSRCHGWDVYFHVHSTNYLPFRGLIGEKLSLIFPISNKGQEYIREKWRIGENIEKVEVQRLGVDESGIDELNEVVQNGFHIVSCSNVIPLKRVHLIVEALSLVGDLRINWTHFGDGILLPELEELAKGSLKENISFDFKGRTSNQEVLDFYCEQKPSLFINVSTTEGIPVSIMEAMSFSTPVFATDVGGTSEIVTNENGALLSPNITAIELAEKIQSFFQSPKELREKKRSLAHETWKTRYSAKANYAKFAQVLCKLID